MTEEVENKKRLRDFSFDIGLDLFGVADVTQVRSEFRLKNELKGSFRSGAVIGKRVLGSVLEDIEDRPTPLYFHHYRQLNFFLDRAAFLLAAFIGDRGFKGLPIPASQVIDWEKQQAHLSHKKIGRLAGLGWIGRNNLLVHPEFGSQFRLATVLTDMPLEPDQAAAGDCGDCIDCLSICPAGAIKSRPEDFDHIACFEKLREFRRSGVVGQYICGICVKSCRGSCEPG
ncbi:MAG: reductive dehalogenase domain-containing protein [Candidatus Aminicenantales bacterium]